VSGTGLDCGAGGAGVCDVRVPPGTAVTLTANAAANARFVGFGGACSGNEAPCQLVVKSDTHVTATFELEVQTLIPDDGISFPTHTNLLSLAINSSEVFLGRHSAVDASITLWSVPKTGGGPATLTSGFPAFLVADDAFLYWTDQNALWSVPVGGGAASQLFAGVPMGRIALDEQGALYWVEIGRVNNPGAIHRVQNRADQVIASGQAANGGVAVDGTFAYFTAFDGKQGSLERVPRQGGSVEMIALTSAEPTLLRVDSQNLYFGDAAGTVWAVDKGGGVPRLLSPRDTGAGTFQVVGLDVSSSVVWWTSRGTMRSGLFRANPDGTGFEAVDTSSDLEWGEPRVDDNAVYYDRGGAIVRRLK
jgi:hypothetical protein